MSLCTSSSCSSCLWENTLNSSVVYKLHRKNTHIEWRICISLPLLCIMSSVSTAQDTNGTSRVHTSYPSSVCIRKHLLLIEINVSSCRIILLFPASSSLLFPVLLQKSCNQLFLSDNFTELHRRNIYSLVFTLMLWFWRFCLRFYRKI